MENLLRDLCGELKKEVDVEVIVANERPETTEEREPGLVIKRAGTWFNYESTPVCPGLLWLVRKSRPDLIHLHLPNPVGVAAYLASGFRGPLVVSYHSDNLRINPFTEALGHLVHRVLRRAQTVIVSSEKYIESSPVLSAHREKCRVVPWGISLDPFDQNHRLEVEEIRRRHGPNLLLGVGRLVSYKGFIHLIRALPRTGAKLLIIGTGPQKKALESEIKALNLEDRALLLGEVEDAVPYFQACDIFVLPSVNRAEAFGIVQLEAMACRKPVINTRIDSGAPSVSLDGVTGLTVSPENPEALARAINRLLEEEALRVEYGKAARQRVESEFTLEQMVKKTLEIYSAVTR
jgi:rhamnosyl/mannosyltransferase